MSNVKHSKVFCKARTELSDFFDTFKANVDHKQIQYEHRTRSQVETGIEYFVQNGSRK